MAIRRMRARWERDPSTHPSNREKRPTRRVQRALNDPFFSAESARDQKVADALRKTAKAQQQRSAQQQFAPVAAPSALQTPPQRQHAS